MFFSDDRAGGGADDISSTASSPVETHNNLFLEPEGYFPPTPPPKTETYTFTSYHPSFPSGSSSPSSSSSSSSPSSHSPSSSSSSLPSSTAFHRHDNAPKEEKNQQLPPPPTITLHLVGHSPTEAHHLWNGARVLAGFLERHPHLVRGKTVLELGAGAGLPSLVGAVLGARRVVMTDYPDVDIVRSMWRNIDECAHLLPPSKKKKTTTASFARGEDANGGDEDQKTRPTPPQGRGANNHDDYDDQDEDQDIICAKGFVWGADPTPLLSALPSSSPNNDTTTTPPSSPQKFDVLILADLLFRHTEHGHLLDTVRDTMAPRGGQAFVFFTSYRPWLRHKDLAFFDLARARGFVVDLVLETKMDRPMFEEDPGDEEVRKTCTGWVVRWPTSEEAAAAEATA